MTVRARIRPVVWPKGDVGLCRATDLERADIGRTGDETRPDEGYLEPRVTHSPRREPRSPGRRRAGRLGSGGAVDGGPDAGVVEGTRRSIVDRDHRRGGPPAAAATRGR